MKMPRWFIYSVITAVLWGIWGALSEYPAKYIHPPFPTTLIFVINALTIIPVAIISLNKIHWRPAYSPAAIGYGLAAGFTGAGGQLLLFIALKYGPPYLIFPIISLSPAITVIMSFILLKEKTGIRGKIGIVLALVSIFLMSVQKAEQPGHIGNLIWLWLSLIIFGLWGVQAYVIKASTKSMNEDSMFFYLALTLQIVIPFAIMLTDFTQPINWGFQGPYLSIFIQLLNTVGVLFFVYSFKEGKAIIVAPIINGLYPVITIIISLLIYWQLPFYVNGFGMVVAVIAIVLISYDEGLRSTPSIPDVKDPTQIT
jgi:drug/metabolite transporter (DMT)-like permease